VVEVVEAVEAVEVVEVVEVQALGVFLRPLGIGEDEKVLEQCQLHGAAEGFPPTPRVPKRLQKVKKPQKKK
jgi:hypothetical protein